MKEHRFKEQCDICGKWSYKYATSDDKICCEKCYNKIKHKEKNDSKKLKKIRKEMNNIE